MRRKKQRTSDSSTNTKQPHAPPLTFTKPVRLSPKLPNLDRISEILDRVENEDERH